MNYPRIEIKENSFLTYLGSVYGTILTPLHIRINNKAEIARAFVKKECGEGGHLADGHLRYCDYCVNMRQRQRVASEMIEMKELRDRNYVNLNNINPVFRGIFAPFIPSN